MAHANRQARTAWHRLVEMSDRRPWLPALWLGTVATLLRVIWVLAVDRVGFAFNDAIMYHSTAESLSRGDGYVPFTGGPTARWPPGYSTLLGGIYRVVGIEPVAGELVNALLGGIAVVVLTLVVTQAIDRTTGVVAGAMLAVLPGPILWTDVLISETLYTAMFVATIGLLLRSRPTWRWGIAVGTAVGLGALVRGEAFTWLVLPVALWWPSVERRELIRPMLVAVAATAVVIAPWTVRNAVVMDAFVPVATNASQTLWSGHNPDATGGQVYPSAAYLDQFPGDVRTKELESSRALRNDALEYLATHPVREVELIPLKLVHLLRGDSYALDWVNAGQEGHPVPLSPVDVERIAVLADLGWFGLLTLTLLGGVVLGRRWWRTPVGRVAATSFATAVFLYGFAYYGNYRYRLPYEPLMVIVAASFIVQVVRWRRASTVPE